MLRTRRGRGVALSCAQPSTQTPFPSTPPRMWQEFVFCFSVIFARLGGGARAFVCVRETDLAAAVIVAPTACVCAGSSASATSRSAPTFSSGPAPTATCKHCTLCMACGVLGMLRWWHTAHAATALPVPHVPPAPENRALMHHSHTCVRAHVRRVGATKGPPRCDVLALRRLLGFPLPGLVLPGLAWRVTRQVHEAQRRRHRRVAVGGVRLHAPTATVAVAVAGAVAGAVRGVRHEAWNIGCTTPCSGLCSLHRAQAPRGALMRAARRGEAR